MHTRAQVFQEREALVADVTGLLTDVGLHMIGQKVFLREALVANFATERLFTGLIR